MKHLHEPVVAAALAWWTAAPRPTLPTTRAASAPAPPPAGAYAVACAAPAYVAPSGDPCCLRCPQWTISLGAWFYGMDGTVGAGGRRLDVDSEWTDILDNLDLIEFSLNARVRLATNKWRFTVGVDGATLEDSAEFRQGGLVDASLDLWTGYATVGYVIAGGRTDCSACAGTWCLDAYAGSRYWNVGVDVEATPGPVGALGGVAVDRTQDWFDPIVGLHLEVTWPKWYVILEGDVGGFGVGSDFTWNAMGAVGYRFNCNFSIFAGWRVLDTDYQDGDFIFDVTMSGPGIGSRSRSEVSRRRTSRRRPLSPIGGGPRRSARPRRSRSSPGRGSCRR